jgi:hypothetical protein
LSFDRLLFLLPLDLLNPLSNRLTFLLQSLFALAQFRFVEQPI